MGRRTEGEGEKAGFTSHTSHTRTTLVCGVIHVHGAWCMVSHVVMMVVVVIMVSMLMINELSELLHVAFFYLARWESMRQA